MTVRHDPSLVRCNLHLDPRASFRQFVSYIFRLFGGWDGDLKTGDRHHFSNEGSEHGSAIDPKLDLAGEVLRREAEPTFPLDVCQLDLEDHLPGSLISSNSGLLNVERQWFRDGSRHQ
jgi:hypothetical protein